MAIVVLRNMVIGIFLPSSRTYLQPTADFQQQCNLESCKYGTLIPKHPAILQHVLAFGTAASFKTYGRESFPIARSEGSAPSCFRFRGTLRTLSWISTPSLSSWKRRGQVSMRKSIGMARNVQRQHWGWTWPPRQSQPGQELKSITQLPSIKSCNSLDCKGF